MKKAHWAVAAALLLAGCGQPGGRQSEAAGGGTAGTAPAAASATPPAAVAAPVQRQIGTVSALTGTQSNLTGAISGFEVRRTETETVATLAADTLFAFDSATIASAAADNLARTAALVRAGGAGAVRVVGHSDGKGSDAYNDDLSRRRAQAVADRLKQDATLAGRSFMVEGHGNREPILPDTLPDGSDNPEGRARNRRVEVVIPR